MAVLIALLISLGIITTPEQATPEIIDQYQEVISGDIDMY